MGGVSRAGWVSSALSDDKTQSAAPVVNRVDITACWEMESAHHRPNSQPAARRRDRVPLSFNTANNMRLTETCRASRSVPHQSWSTKIAMRQAIEPLTAQPCSLLGRLSSSNRFLSLSTSTGFLDYICARIEAAYWE
jgi:hypothetical protein